MTSTSMHHSLSQGQLSKQSISSHYKLVLIGQHSVGKTSILSQYINHSFISNYIPTIGLGYYIKEVKVSKTINQTVSFELWDTSSLDKAQELNMKIIQEAHIILMVYDITRKETLDFIKKYYQELKLTDQVIVVVVCNKIDKREENENIKSQGEEFAKGIKAMFQATSAKAANGINDLFNNIGGKIIGDSECEDYAIEEYNTSSELNKKNNDPEVKQATPEAKTNTKDTKCIMF